MGRNARVRKEQKIIEKYGKLPEPKKAMPWGRVGIILLIATLLIIFGIIGYQKIKNKPAVSASPSPTAATTPTAAAETTSETKEQQTMTATITTTMGDIKLELYPADAPKTVDNFKQLAQKGYYNGVIFHRVIQDFMIQAGDPTGTGAGGESAFGGSFEDEINDHKIEAGTLAMANRGPNTNGSQFFIVTEQPQPHLDGKHTVFGKVSEGMDVVKKIAAVEVDEADKPKQEVKIIGVTVEQAN